MRYQRLEQVPAQSADADQAVHMPRTMLCYAIEKIDEARRQAYLKGAL